MKKILFILLFVLLANLFSQPQTKEKIILPSPLIGWDSLSTFINYYDLARRTNISTGYIAKVQIDSFGIVQEVHVFELTFDKKRVDLNSPLVSSINTAMRHHLWNPAMQGGKKINFTLEIPVVFIINNKNQAPLIIKNVPESIIYR
ncbi:MAG: hypothetical protein WC209_00095 [Ignavibacteriaceae bacterium]|jgi:hypothetical protein